MVWENIAPGALIAGKLFSPMMAGIVKGKLTLVPDPIIVTVYVLAPEVTVTDPLGKPATEVGGTISPEVAVKGSGVPLVLKASSTVWSLPLRNVSWFIASAALMGIW